MPKFEQFEFLWFFGSLAIFLYGIRLSRQGLQLWFGDRLKPLMARLTQNRFSSFAIGILITLVFQSSSATVITLASFAGSGSITLFQAMGVMLGADIGTTLVVLLLSMQSIANYALLFLALGVLIELYGKSKKSHYLAMILMGFGFIFFGLKLLTLSTFPLRESGTFLNLFSFIKSRPLLALILTTILTPFLSSAGSIGITIGLSFSGILNFAEAVPMVLGANLGSTLTPFFASLSEGQKGKQVAVAHIFFKVTGVILLLPFMHQVPLWINQLDFYLGSLNQSASHKIAMFHLVFNVVLSLSFIPFIRLGHRFIQTIIPIRENDSDDFRLKYIRPDNEDSPLLVLSNLRREVLRLGDFVHYILKYTVKAFSKYDPDLISEIEIADEKANALHREIKLFITRIPRDNMTDDQLKDVLILLTVTDNLDEMGDTLVRNMLETSGKKIHSGKKFSDQGWQEIQEFHKETLELYEMALSLVTTGGEDMARKIVHKTSHLRVYEAELRNRHLERLQNGQKESVATSALHLDTLVAIKRVVGNVRKIGKAFLNDENKR